MQLRNIPHPDKSTKAELDAWVEEHIFTPRRESLARARARAKARRERIKAGPVVKAPYAEDFAMLAKVRQGVMARYEVTVTRELQVYVVLDIKAEHEIEAHAKATVEADKIPYSDWHETIWSNRDGGYIEVEDYPTEEEGQ